MQFEIAGAVNGEETPQKQEPEPGRFRSVKGMRKALIERGQWPWEEYNTDDEDVRFFDGFCKAWEYFEAENEIYPMVKNFDRFRYAMENFDRFKRIFEQGSISHEWYAKC